MPLKPGTRYTYEGTTIEDDGTAVPHRFVVNVTDLTKVIGGVRSAVTWDLDYSDGQLVEAELAFFAQDSSGTVWLMGEYPEEYDEGKFIAATPWLHGLEQAQAGIMMPAKPQTGTPDFAQGWGPAVNWTDRARVDQLGQKTCVPVRCYEDVLIMAETSGSEPDAQQLKYYARTVGNVRVGWRAPARKRKRPWSSCGSSSSARRSWPPCATKHWRSNGAHTSAARPSMGVLHLLNGCPDRYVHCPPVFRLRFR
jgi:hypothetical protein